MKTIESNGFDTYKSEAQERWGKIDAYKEYSEKSKNYGKDKWNDLIADMDKIFEEFAVCMKNSMAPDSSEAQNLVKKLQNHITENYYNCTNEILVGLSQMYVADERFKKNIDKHADGTAEFVRDSVALLF